MVGLYKYNQNKEKFKPLKGALMKKSKERFLSFTLSSKTRAASMKIAMTLTAAAVFALSPAAPAVVGTEITVQAANYNDSTDANIEFTVNEDGKTATITNYKGSASSLTIPETVSYGGTTYTVTAIGNEAFGRANGTTDLSTTEIVIPGTVKTIGNSAFEGSSSIKKITIGEGVQSIGERAFYGLTGLTEISFPESVVNIGPSVCENNTSLKTVTIAGEIFEYDFGSGAFSGCTSLETVNITGSVDQIPDEAFSGCEKLSSLTLAEGITRIGSDAFYHCTSLQTISLPSTVKSIGSSAFYESGLKEIVVPENVTEIGMAAFAECKALESVTIKGRITEIPTSLFENCTKLKTVKLPVGITSIGASAFCENNSLTNIAIGRSGVSDYTLIIPDTVTSIKQNAFQSEGRSADNKFTYVDMGSGVSSLGARAFEGFKTTTVITSKALDTISLNAFHNTGAEYVYITRVPENTESTVVKSDAFSGCSIKELYLPSSVRTKNALKSNCFEGSGAPNDGDNSVIPNIYTDASATTSITLDALKSIMSNVQNSGDWTWYVPTTTDTPGTTVETKALADVLPALSGQGTADSAETVAVTSVSLNKSSIELAVGDTKTLTKTISPANATISNVEWTSDDPNVVAVSANGRIRGIAVGTTTITVTTDDGAKKATCTVTVSGEVSKVSVTGVSLDKPALELTEGDTTTLTATVTPDNATNTDVTWSSTNPSVATVDAEGKVTAVAAGTTTITVTTVDGEMTATCPVTVTAKTTEIENFVDRLYTNLLNQSVNATEKASYVNSLSAKTTTAADAVADFALSDSIAKITNEEFVSRMYRAVFNRDADDGGRVTWENLLNNGMSRKIVIQKFTESEEFANICASCGMAQGKYESDEIRDSNIYVTSFVNNLYLTILWRTPDAAGINNFVGALLNGASTDGIIKEFILGAECTSKNYTNEEFIIACFGGILGRTGPTVDAIDGGRLFLDTLNAGGLTREGVVNSLLNSEEYKNRLNAIGLTK